MSKLTEKYSSDRPSLLAFDRVSAEDVGPLVKELMSEGRTVSNVSVLLNLPTGTYNVKVHYH